jgi:hypothetical protein
MKEVIDAESYILGFPVPVQSLLFELRNCIKKTAPQAEEIISYQMPAYNVPQPRNPQDSPERPKGSDSGNAEITRRIKKIT